MDNTRARKLMHTFTCPPGEIIETIKEMNNPTIGWLSFRVHTSHQDIVIKLSNVRNCCEVYGIYCSERRRNEVIGAEVSCVNLYERLEPGRPEFEKSIILELMTDRGPLDLYAYCEHNGYYPHDYSILIGDRVINGSI